MHTLGSVVDVGENDIKDGERLHLLERENVEIKKHIEVLVLDEKGPSGGSVRRGRGPRLA